MGEFELIKYIQTRLARPLPESVVLGIGDDAAILATPSNQHVVVTSDTLNAGVHFPRDTSAENIGYKSLAVSLSDLASMGAKPWWFNLNLSLIDLDFDWMEGLLDGLNDAMDGNDIVIIGGDTTGGPMSLSITAAGLCEPGKALRRDGAKPGEDVWVSGSIGDAACALQHMDTASVDLMARLNRPTARLELGQKLAHDGLASSCADISDGLLADAGNIAARSGVAIQIIAADIPIADEVKRLDPNNALKYAATGGDDYELVFTAGAAHRNALKNLSAELNLPLTRIGTVLQGQGVHLLDADGAEVSVKSLGYDHFSST